MQLVMIVVAYKNHVIYCQQEHVLEMVALRDMVSVVWRE
jgi:hypothetical protein